MSITRLEIDDELWVEWLRPEFDRCTAHGLPILAVHDKGPAAQPALVVGTVWHVEEPCRYGVEGEFFISACVPDEHADAQAVRQEEP
jgi:hypothetical protein